MTRVVVTSLCLALLGAGAGCATRSTALRPMPAETQAEINSLVAGRNVDLVVEGQRPLRGEVRVGEHSVWFREPDGVPTLFSRAKWLPEVEVPFTSVQQIEVRERGRGALHGFGIGAAIGVVLGSVGGALLGGICERSSCSGSFAAIGGLAGGAASACSARGWAPP